MPEITTYDLQTGKIGPYFAGPRLDDLTKNVPEGFGYIEDGVNGSLFRIDPETRQPVPK